MIGRVLSQHVQRHVLLGGAWREPSSEVGSEGGEGRGEGRRGGGRGGGRGGEGRCIIIVNGGRVEGLIKNSSCLLPRNSKAVHLATH